MLIYLDTNIWVYAFENDPICGQIAQQVFQKLQQPLHRIASSRFVLGELLVRPMRQGNSFAIAQYQRLFQSHELRLAPFEATACNAYSKIRAAHRVKPLDALHLASAAASSVDLFITRDDGVLNLQQSPIPGIGRITSMADALLLL